MACRGRNNLSSLLDLSDLNALFQVIVALLTGKDN